MNKPDLWMPEPAREERRKRRVDPNRIMVDQLEENRGEAGELQKSINEARRSGALFPRNLDPLFVDLGAYKGIIDPNRATSLTEILLRQAAEACSLVAIVHGMRTMQVKRYAQPGVDPLEPGFDIVMVDRDERPSPIDRKYMARIKQALLRGGSESVHPTTGQRAVWTGDFFQRGWPLVRLLTGLVRDSLTLDRAVVWMNRSRDSQDWPYTCWVGLDAERVRKVLPQSYKRAGTDKEDAKPEVYEPYLRPGKPVDYVLLRPQASVLGAEKEQVCAEYSEEDVLYLVRNWRTEWWAEGYGHSELEQLTGEITGLINATAYNKSWFTNNSIPTGILHGEGDWDDVDERWIQDLVSTLVSQAMGATKMHKLPILFTSAGSHLNWIPFRNSDGEDMAWRQWQIWLLNIITARYAMASEEINFQAFLSQGGTLTQAGGAERVAQAQSTGLRVLLSEILALLNNGLVGRFYPDRETGTGPFEAVFYGVKTEDAEALHRRKLERVNAGFETLNEARATEDKPPYRDPEDGELWDRVRELAIAGTPELERDPMRLDEWCARAYRKLGKTLRRWTDMPISSQALQAQMQEDQREQAAAQQEQGGGMPPGGMPPGMGQPGGFGGAGGEGDFPPGEDDQEAGPPQPQRPGGAPPAGKPKGLIKSLVAQAANAGKKWRRRHVIEITVEE